jgi:peptide/nickel transport system substrate-binding protein
MSRDTASGLLTELVEASKRHDVTRRDLLKIAGAAAVASGLTGTFPGVHQAAAQDEGTVFIYGSGQDISNLDPHTGNDYSITFGQRAVYDSLLRFEGIPLEIKPLVATEATSNADASVWTIKLDERAVFPDGSAVDAEVVKWNFTRLLTKNKGVSWMFTDVMTPDSVVVVDPLTVEITLSKPFAPFDLTLPWLFLANPAVVAENAGSDDGETWLIDHAAGSGPYDIGRWEPGNLYEFIRRADYWYTTEGVTAPIDTFIWRIIRESSTKRIAMEAGEIHYGDVFTLEDVEALATVEGLTINQIPSWSPFAVKLNNQAGPTADVNVRKALSAALDYDAVIQAVSGRGETLVGPLPTRLEPWHKPDLPVIKHDMEAAKAHLAASAYPEGFDLEYVYVTGIAIEEQIGLILLEKLAELNINLTITPLVWPDLVARAATPETSPGMLAVYYGVSYLDPDAILWPSFHSSQAGSWSNSSQYQNPEFDKILEDARSTTDQAARKALYDQAQLMLVENAVEIFVYTEIPNDAWVSTLGENGLEGKGSDIRTIQYVS